MFGILASPSGRVSRDHHEEVFRKGLQRRKSFVQKNYEESSLLLEALESTSLSFLSSFLRSRTSGQYRAPPMFRTSVATIKGPWYILFIFLSSPFSLSSSLIWLFPRILVFKFLLRPSNQIRTFTLSYLLERLSFPCSSFLLPNLFRRRLGITQGADLKLDSAGKISNLWILLHAPLLFKRSLLLFREISLLIPNSKHIKEWDSIFTVNLRFFSVRESAQGVTLYFL